MKPPLKLEVNESEQGTEGAKYDSPGQRVAGLRRDSGCVKTVPPAFFSLTQPFTAGYRRIDWQARFIGLPGLLELKRERNPDESGSNGLSEPSQP
jgi:hypothetical protein